MSTRPTAPLIFLLALACAASCQRLSAPGALDPDAPAGGGSLDGGPAPGDPDGGDPRLPDGGDPDGGTIAPDPDGGLGPDDPDGGVDAGMPVDPRIGMPCSRSRLCPEDLTCDLLASQCVLPVDQCEGIECDDDQRCRTGTCVQACEDDPCIGVQCADRHRCDARTGQCVLETLCDRVFCPPDTLCNPDSGMCEMVTQTGVGEVGAPCTHERDCLSAGPQPLCLSARFIGWPGGYCSSDCSRGAACPSNARCAVFGRLGFCLDRCTHVSQCREGYLCITLPASLIGETDSVCIPVEESNCDEATISELECTIDRHCEGAGICDQSRGRCTCAGGGDRCDLTSQCTDGLSCVQLPGGFCTKLGCSLVDPLADCPDGMGCLPIGGIGSACLTICNPEKRGEASDCRERYNCLPYLGAGLCVPRSCNHDDECRRRCRCELSAEQCGEGLNCDERGFCETRPCSEDSAAFNCGHPAGCGEDGRCLPFRCDVPSGTCDRPCNSDDDCGFARRCDVETARCYRPCDDSNAALNCGEHGICDLRRGRCVTRCESNDDCNFDEVCDPASLMCVAPCRSNAECQDRPGGFADRCNRENALCMTPCREGRPCPGRTQCYGEPRFCRPPCTEDADCLGEDYCDPHTESCRPPCSSDEECTLTPDESCHPVGRCAPPCDLDFRCRINGNERCDSTINQCVFR